MIVLLNQPCPGALGRGVVVPGELLAVLQGNLETQCQDGGIKCKVNKNNSKCT